MSKLKALQESLGDKKTQLRGLLVATEGEQARSLTTEEQTRLDVLNTEVDNINEQIRSEENLERARKNVAIDKANRETEEEKLNNAISMSRVANIQMGFAKLDGAEREMDDECNKEARAIGLPTRGGILYKRQSVTTTPASAGLMIPTTLNPSSPGAAKVGFDGLGVRKITGLTGVNNMPVLDLLAESAFVGEGAGHTDVDPTVRNAQLTAKALRTKIGSSWLMRAMGVEIDSILTQTLEAAKVNLLNKTIMTGAGSATVPVGILTAANVVDVTGANGTAISFALLLKMLNSPSDNDSSFVNPAWASSPAVREVLSALKVDAGSGDMVWPYNTPNVLMGYNAAVSTHVPKNLTKGSGTNLKALVYGYWDQFVAAEWAIKEMIEDKVTDETGPKLIEITFTDNAVLNPKAFVKGYFLDPA